MRVGRVWMGAGMGVGGEGSSEPAPGEVPPEENIKLFSTLITRTAQDIDTLIDSLPSSEYTAEMQVCSLASACVECVRTRVCVCLHCMLFARHMCTHVRMRTIQHVGLCVLSCTYTCASSRHHLLLVQVADLRKLDQANRELTQKLSAMVEQGGGRASCCV